jgi:putative colanic acid biosysnthesis UDP-glucose lipid carrier transferase
MFTIRLNYLLTDGGGVEEASMFVDYENRALSRVIDRSDSNSVDKSNLKIAIKRVFDVCVAGVILVLVSPVLLLVAFAIKFESSGPVFFRQTRNGLNGSTFEIFKFRSMRHAPTQEFEQAVKGDARITWLGSFLRKSSIDELPQLLNVLKGEMSIVGPRPHPLALDAQYTAELPNFMNRYNVKPGLTGLAQISGHRGPTATADLMKKRLDADLKYIAVQTSILDLKILLRTVPAVLSSQNAF